MGFRIFNTFTRQKEDFQPADPEGRRVGFYNCGPTVYGPFHIGNARNFVVADTLRRWLQRLGYEVRFVQNITDVDDKIIARAQKEGRSPEDVAREFTALFFEHAGRLGVRPADAHPKATEYIGPMIAMVERLIAGGHAYATPDGSVWFRTASYARYGELSKKPMDELREGERVDAEQQRLKENPADFCLWKASKPGEPAWPSPWGQGRPGWHTECAVMSRDLLGDTLDIHMGGVDLVFPHHENERAQSECVTGQTFVRYWAHNGFLNIRDEATGEDQKMSKSLGNVFLIDQLLERFDALTLRHFLVSAHYRSPLTFSGENLHASRAATRRLLEALARARRVLGAGEAAAADVNAATAAASEDARRRAAGLRERFAAAMNDDLNTPVALAEVFAAAQELNRALDRADRAAGDAAAQEAARADAALFRALLLGEFLDVLGLDPALAREDAPAGAAAADALAPKLIELLLAIRQDARKRKLFDLADRIRDDLAALGVAVEDTPQGPVWKRKD